jgi:hypothetical protein
LWQAVEDLKTPKYRSEVLRWMQSTDQTPPSLTWISEEVLCMNSGWIRKLLLESMEEQIRKETPKARVEAKVHPSL